MTKLTPTTLLPTTLLLAFLACLGGCESSDDRASSPDGGGGSLRDGGDQGAGGGGEASLGDAGLSPNGGIVLVKDAVFLGVAGNFAVLAKSGISTVPTSAITGNIGVSPAAASYITGFSLSADATNRFSTSKQVTGRVFASDYALPTPPNLTTAVGDMERAFIDASGRAPTTTELGAGDIGGRTLAPGVYRWSSGLLIPTGVTLAGSETGVWIFQIAQNLTMSNGTRVNLTGGALPKNVFWQVSGSVDLGTTTHFEGILLSKTAIAVHTGATLTGRLYAQTAVTIEGSAIVAPLP